MKVFLSCLTFLFIFASCDFIHQEISVAEASPILLYDASWETQTVSSTINAPSTDAPMPPPDESKQDENKPNEIKQNESHTAPSPTPTAAQSLDTTEDPVQEPVAASPLPAEPEPTLSATVNTPSEVTNPYPVSFQQTTSDDIAALPNDSAGWYFNRNSDHQPPTAQRVFDIRTFDAHYLGDINRKRMYLTFDEGYENGFTAPILDILKEKNVHAAFFLTRTYIRDNPDLCKRMAQEGHVVANHSWRHLSFPTLSEEQIAEELNETARYFEDVTGYVMAPFFRPPEGTYSQRTLALTQRHGYTTVFWSLTHMDWLVDDQPGKAVTFNRVMDNIHNGAIILLHAVSESNTEALPDIIDAVRANGYEFGSLWDLR